MPPRSVARRWAILLALLCLLAVPSLAWAQPTEEAVRRVARQLQCPVCLGQSVAESNAGLATDMKTVIREQLAQGKTDQQILDFFVAAYGDSILSDPPKRGLMLVVWIGPIVGLVAGAALLAVLMSSWLRHRPAAPSPHGATVAGPVADEFQRFREEFSR